MTAASGFRARALVVAYDFPPHAAIGTMRTLRVVRELDARGWQVTVLTGDPSAYLPGTPIDRALLERVPPGVRVIAAGAIRPWDRVQSVARSILRPGRPVEASAAETRPKAAAAPAAQKKGAALRPLAALSDLIDAALSIPDRESGWIVPALTKGVLKQLGASKPDVIYSSSPPWSGQLVAAGLKAVLRRPWVTDFRDPWSRAPWRGDRYQFALRAAAALERAIVRRADRIVFVAAGNRDDFAAHYGASIASKFDVVSNGCDPAEFDALRGTVAPAPDGPFVLLHAGSLYAGRTPVPLLNAVARAIADGRIQRDRFRLRFLGVNALKGVDLAGTCQALGIGDVVEFLPRVKRDESLRAMMTASGLLLLQPGHTVSVPGKVYRIPGRRAADFRDR